MIWKKKLAASSRAFTFSWGSVVFKAWAWWSRTYDLSISFIRRWVPFTTGCLIDSQVQDGHKMETKQLYKGYRRIVQGLYKGYHTSKPKNPRSWILNLDRSETSVRGREHCSQVSSTYYFEYLLIWQRNLARPFNSFFLFSHLKILQEKVKRKNNNKTHHEVQPSTCRPAAKDTSLASRATSIWANASQSWLCIFLRGGVWILFSTVQTRSIISLKQYCLHFNSPSWNCLCGRGSLSSKITSPMVVPWVLLAFNHPDHYTVV